jgi:hypothetical protein
MSGPPGGKDVPDTFNSPAARESLTLLVLESSNPSRTDTVRLVAPRSRWACWCRAISQAMNCPIARKNADRVSQSGGACWSPAATSSGSSGPARAPARIEASAAPR